MKTLSKGEKIFRMITLAIAGLLLALFSVWGILYYRVGEIITPFFIFSPAKT